MGANEIQEHDLLPPAEGLLQRRESLNLSPNEKVQLVRWATSPEYQIFLRLAESIIEKNETAHFKTWKDKELFERTGLTAVAQRLFFEQLQKQVNVEFEEFSGEIEFAKKQKENANESPEEMIQRGFK